MDIDNNINFSSSSQEEETKNQIEIKNINDKIEYKENEYNNSSNKKKDDLKTYIMDHRRKIYERIEGMEREEKSTFYNSQLYSNKAHYGNIGSNIVLCKKFVIGIKKNLLLFFLTIIGISLTWFGWVFSCDNFYSKKLYFICGISYFLTIFFMALSFLIEPGIIPRKCPEFSKIMEDNNKDNKTIDLKEEEKNDNDKEKNINENEEKKNKNIDIQKEGKIIPNIFKERKCFTCNIIRPPGASHCRICDNCVQNFDHHCYYISNCVGKRNHKCFYLFLFFGSICGIEVSIFSFITIYHLFIIKFNETILNLYKGNKYLFILSILLMVIGLLYAYCGVRDLFCLIIPLLIGLCIFIRMWYKYLYILNKLPGYYNPFILIVFISAISLCLFATSAFLGQTIYICSGYTLKQNRSIRNEIIELSYKHSHSEIKREYTRNKTLKEKIKNMISFLKSDIGKSLIIPERDLFK